MRGCTPGAPGGNDASREQKSVREAEAMPSHVVLPASSIPEQPFEQSFTGDERRIAALAVAQGRALAVVRIEIVGRLPVHFAIPLRVTSTHSLCT